MNLELFIQSLSFIEKKKLLHLLQADAASPENLTLRSFLQLHADNNSLPIRLFTAYGYALSLEKKYPGHSVLDKPVRDVTFEELGRLKGVGRVTWQSFVRLRGY